MSVCDSKDFPIANRYEVVSRFLCDRASLEWKIENFSACFAKVDQCIDSPKFSSTDAEWYMRIYPNGESYAETQGDIGLYLMKNSSARQEDCVVFRICLKDKRHEECYISEFDHNFDCVTPGYGKPSVISRSVLIHEKAGELLPNDTLTIYCELTVQADIVHGIPKKVIGNKTLKYTKSPCSIECYEGLANEFATLYGDKKSCDVTLKAEDKEFRAHKSILGARSTVFRAMFEHDMQEKRNSVVNITDMPASIVDALLWYIYSGKVSNVNLEKAIGLFIAADKYVLPELKTECSRYMTTNLSADNVCSIAELADSPGDEALMEAVKHFMRDNTCSVLDKSDWRDLVRDRPHITTDLLEAVIFPLFVSDSSVFAKANR